MKNSIKYRLPEEIIKQLVHWSSGFFSPSDFDRIIISLESELSKYHITRDHESNLIRILNAVIDKISFLSDFLKYPHHVEITSIIAANSNYLTDILVRNPESLYQVFSPDYLEKKITLNNLMNEINEGLEHFKSFESKIKFLRATKRRYILKIALNDLHNNKPVENITSDLSKLAIAINRSLFMLCYKEILNSCGINNITKQFTLMSLGKLGGNELNYSSDIDLILIYDSNENVGVEKRYDYHEVLIKTTNLYISKATEFTELGNLYRVDFRLRPDGGIAPLCRTLLDTMNYYESRGEQWERQMLIKLNFLAGSEKLYLQFKSFVDAYVYQGIIKTSPLAAIKEMKLAIEKHHSGDDNIKTSPGGIRDIEFTVQALQLLNGKRIKDLRTSTTLSAISVLRDNKLLTSEETVLLREAYKYYRKIEHFLQLMNNTQTHTIPESTELRRSLAVYMKCRNEKELFKNISNYRKDVRKIYDTLISGKDKKAKQDTRIKPVVFKDSKRAVRDLKFLELGTGLISLKNFDSNTTKLFQKIKPVFFKLLNESFNPDHVLENFVKIVSSYKLPAIFYEELENEKFFKQILRICERSNYAVNHLINQPQYVEDLISRSAFTKNLSDFIGSYTFDRFKFTLAVQFSLNLIEPAKISSLLIDYVSHTLQLRFNEFFKEDYLFVAGLGSYGTKEMTFFSDLDLIIVIDDIKKNPAIHESAQKYLKKVQNDLHTLEVDFRLRPEGKSSPLVWDINNYNAYLSKRAGIWEFQSLFKMRLAAGNKNLFDKFRKIVLNKLLQIEPGKILTEIYDMHKKVTAHPSISAIKKIELKRTSGGLTTIDYYLSYYQLTNPSYHKYCGKPEYSKRRMIRINNISVPGMNTVKENYNYFKELEFILQNSFEQKKSIIPQDTIKLNLLVRFMKEIDSRTMEQKILRMMRENMTLFNSINSNRT